MGAASPVRRGGDEAGEGVAMAAMGGMEEPLAEQDPSVVDGFRVVYDREVPFELRANEEEEGQLDAVRAKILIQGESHAPEAVRVELGCESDLFFHYTHQLDELSFAELQREQKLMVEFNEYAHVLIRMFNSAIKEPQQYLAVFVLQEDNTGRVDFMQNAMYKFLELLSIQFAPSPGNAVRQHIHFRYNTMKARLAAMQQRLNEVYATVKVKNPSLLLQLQQMHGPAK